MNMFGYLKYGLSAILSYVGVKMLISGFYKINDLVSLGIIGGLLAISIFASMIWKKPEEKPADQL